MQQSQEIYLDLQLPDRVEESTLQLKDLNKELLVLRLAFGQLRAAIANAAAPLMAVFVPALTQAVRWATRLVRTVGQVIAGVLGVNATQKALEKTVVSTGKALKRTVAGFDQLNRLQGSSGTSVKTVPVDVPTTLPPQVQQIVNTINTLLEPLKSIEFSPLRWEFERLKEAAAALWAELGPTLTQLWNSVLVPFLAWAVENLAPVLTQTLTEGVKLLHVALLALRDGFGDLWVGAAPVVQFLGETVVTVLQELGNLFGRLRVAIDDDTIKIREIFYLLGLDIKALWDNAGLTLQKMKDGFATVFGNIGDAVITGCNLVLGAVHQLLKNTSSSFHDGWGKLWEGAKSLCSAGINGIIGLLNLLLSGATGAINGVVGLLNKLKITVPDWVPELGGKTFGFQLKTLTAPKIPYLAKGAVLPANQPFLAMVGDQKHGTNIEAPLSTIQQAVAITMEDLQRSNLAGHQATVAVLERILRAVLGIHLGDDVIGQAAQRYQDGIALLRGSVY